MDAIERNDKIYKLINPFKDNWGNNYVTNCYAYALGIDVCYKDLSIKEYTPGFTVNDINIERFDKDILINKVVTDLDNLKIDFRYVNEQYILSKNEWKIAIFGGHKYCFDNFDDFHFLRQTKDGIWTHKQGYFDKPTNLDYDKKEIKLPSKCNIDTHYTNYEYIMTLCLKK